MTARRREESIQSVPVAVSAVGGAELTAEGLTDLVQLGTKMPGLTVAPGNGAGSATPLFAIRGLSQQELTILADPSVTTYMGDIVYARAQGINSAMFDLDRVEVLKGPQGTLFGRNTTGGAIVIRPAQPSTTNEGMAALTFGNHGAAMFEAMANLTLGDRVQLRVAGVIDQDDGYIEDIITGRSVNDTDTQAFRVSLAAQPTDKLDTLFVYNRFIEDDGGTGTFIYDVNTATNATGGYTSTICGAGPTFLGWGSCTQLLADQQARGPFKVQSGAPAFTKIGTWDLTNTTSYAISDSLTVKNIVGYRSVDNHNYEDTDGTPWPVLSIERIDTFTQWSEELQLIGSTEKLDWIVGAYWFNEEGSNQGLSMTAQRRAGARQHRCLRHRTTAARFQQLVEHVGRRRQYEQGALRAGHVELHRPVVVDRGRSLHDGREERRHPQPDRRPDGPDDLPFHRGHGRQPGDSGSPAGHRQLQAAA